MSQISNAKFDGLAFPVARVSYSGDASQWNASIYRDRETTFRARVGYDPAIGGGARGALPAALKALGKALAEIDSDATVADYVAVPGDFSADAYVFTFVPKYFFA